MNGSELAFDENCLILETGDELWVISRAGTTTLKSRNLARFHSIVSKYICGQYDQESILAGVTPNQRPVVERYLSALRGAGAIRATATSGNDCHPRIVFASPDRIRCELRGWKESSGKPGCIYIAVEDKTGAFLASDAADLISRWFGAVAGKSGNRPCTTLYRLRTAPLELKREAVLDPAAGGAELIRQLPLMRPADVPQLPLVCVTASHWLFPATVSRYGMDHVQVERQLQSEFVYEALAADARPSGRVLVSRFSADSVNDSDTAGAAARPTVADSLVQLRAAALETRAQRLPVDESTEIDLLHDPVDHPQIEFLRSVLRLRIARLPGRFSGLREGYFCYQAGSRRYCSFIRTKALRDLLLEAARDAYYADAGADVSPAPPNDFESFVDADELEFLIAATEQRIGREERLLYRKFECWGSTLYCGRYIRRRGCDT